MHESYSNRNLQKTSFRNEELGYASFVNSDLRGADFTGANLTGADLTRVRTGITPINTFLLFCVALAVSLLSGYIAMLTGHTVQLMLKSTDEGIRVSGIATIVIFVLFVLYSNWLGVGNAIYHLILPASVVALTVAIIAYVTGMGTGKGMLFLVLSILLLSIMFVVGTVSRAAAGTLSSTILFIFVALAGGMFGKSLGGGIGTVVMALSCAQISKRALSGARGFETLRKIARFITVTFGTSFRNATLVNADFSESEICNTDFTNADVSSVTWGNTKTINSIIDQRPYTIKMETRG